MGSSKLTTSKWTPPGVYLGRKSVPRPSAPTGSRKICLIGRGSRLKNVLDTEITRSKVYNELLTFVQVGSGSPAEASLYQAPLRHRSNLDKTVSFLIDKNGQVIGPANWQFVESTDVDGNLLGYASAVQLKASAYDRDQTYTITYQSIDRDILDPIPWYPSLSMRGFLYAGDQPSAHQYTEFQDFMISMNAVDPYDLTDPASTAGGFLAHSPMIALTGPVHDPGLTISEFSVDIASHVAGSYRLTINTLVAPVGSTDGSVTYSVSWKAYGTFTWTPVGNYTAAIPAAAASSDPIVIVVDDQLTTRITKAHTVGLTVAEYFDLLVKPFGQFVYHNDFFDTAGRPKYTAKDTRQVDFTVASVIDVNGNPVTGVPTSIPDIVNYTFTSSTQEGGFGTFTVTRPGTSGGGVLAGITAATQASIVAINAPAYSVLHTETIWVVVDKGAVQVVTLTGVTDGAASVPQLTDPTINTQLSGAEFYADGGGNLAIRTTLPGGNHTVQIVGGTAIGPSGIDFSDTEAVGTDAYLTDAAENFGKAFIGRQLTIAGATTVANRGSFTITGVTVGNVVFYRNNNAVTESLPASGTWQVSSPEPNFDRAPFRDGIVLQLDNPTNVVAGQHTRLTISNEHTIDWSLVAPRTEIMDSTKVFNDRVGLVTGVAASSYVLLADVPSVSATTPLVVKDQSDATILSISDPTDERIRHDSNGELTAVVRIPGYNAVTNGDLTVTYSSRGFEPSPGQVYNFSASVLRPTSDYNTVIDFNDGDEAANFLAPSQIDNHLFIGASIAYGQRPKPTAVSIVQVFDADQDGTFTNADFKAAIQASEGDLSITDRITLSNFGTLLDLKTTTIAVNDPFVRGWALDWVGMPVSAPIGSAKVVDSIVYTATKTLQVQGENCARGAFILIPNRWAKKTIQLDDGTQQQLLLDGSFLAVAGAAKTAGFSLPKMSLLRQSVDGFDDIETFSDTDRNVIGAASTAYIEKQGSGWVWGESVTVDTTEPALNEISGRTQEQFVNRYVVIQVDQAMVGVVADSPADLAALTQSYVADTLKSLHSQKIIADWTNDNGTPRKFDTTEDVQAATDPEDPRQVYFNFWYNLYYPGKRFNGLYSVGRNAFKSQTNS